MEGPINAVSWKLLLGEVQDGWGTMGHNEPLRPKTELMGHRAGNLRRNNRLPGIGEQAMSHNETEIGGGGMLEDIGGNCQKKGEASPDPDICYMPEGLKRKPSHW